MGAQMNGGALAGLSVVELGRMVAAPYCAKLLADLGADVVKLEAPGVGRPGAPARSLPRRRSTPGAKLLSSCFSTPASAPSPSISRHRRAARSFGDLILEADVLIEDTRARRARAPRARLSAAGGAEPAAGRHLDHAVRKHRAPTAATGATI